MGIKGLWSILTPICERKPLYELQGKTIAIDLSCWICEAQNIAEYQVQPRMYLRNLYFRACYLLLMNVNPVFVLDGTAPELKCDTIRARNAIQFKGAKPRTGSGRKNTKNGNDRTRFKGILKQCEDMLKFMGLACLRGSGEAEALCAQLNHDKLVDGVISQDSDCFAYGAEIVYKNFSISQQGLRNASGGSVDVYDIQKAFSGLNLGRNKIIALALLCGCDYIEGVHGIGKESALKFFETVDDADILDRFRNWKRNKSVSDDFETALTAKNICTSCGHAGKLAAHKKAGCVQCRTTKGCDFSAFKTERQQMKNEAAIRKKALVDDKFPNEDLIGEFSARKDVVSKLELKWRKPDLIGFVKFTKKYLEWEEIYALEKLLPILTRWQIEHYAQLQEKIRSGPVLGILYPRTIKKTRAPKGVPSYEIVWEDKDGNFEALFPAIETADRDLDAVFTTIEPQSLVDLAHPGLVAAFRAAKAKPAKAKRNRRAKQIDDINKLLADTSISEEKPKKGRKKKPVQENKIETYFKNADLDLSKFGDENDMDLSNIIEDLVSRSPGGFLPEKFRYEEDETTFFGGDVTKADLFETSLYQLRVSSSETSDSGESDNEQVGLNGRENVEEKEDSFVCDNYVPLIKRLKSKMNVNF